MSTPRLYVRAGRSPGRSRWKVHVYDEHGYEVDCYLRGPRLNADGERMRGGLGWASSWHRYDEGREIGCEWTATDDSLTLGDALALFMRFPGVVDALRAAVAEEVTR